MATRLFLYQRKDDPPIHNRGLRTNMSPRHLAGEQRYAQLHALQRIIGNRATGRLIEGRSGNSTSLAGPLSTSIAPSRNAPAHQWIQRRKPRLTPLAAYRKSRTRLGRMLRAANKISSASKRKQAQQRLLRRIAKIILGRNPFAVIKIRKVNYRGQTEWVSPSNHAKGIRLTIGDFVLRDKPANIIATLIHEATHASQLRAGMRYYRLITSHRNYRETTFLKAVRAFAEADAYLETYLTFAKALASKRAGAIMGAIAKHFRAADTELSVMAAGVYTRTDLRKRLTNIFLQKKLKNPKTIVLTWRANRKKLNLKNDLLPWKRMR